MDFKGRPSPSFDASDDPTSVLRIARPSTGAAETMASSPSQSSLHQPQKRLRTSPIVPPPIALSLRVRESSAMSLKHIFDQRMMANAAASRSEPECRPSSPGHQMRGFPGIRNISVADLRKRDIPDLDLAFKKSQGSPFADMLTGFGSPISTPSPANKEAELMNSLCVQQKNRMPHSAAACARFFPSKPTAQMTVFYSGTVNVYDAVPADRAHAIMLLARDSSSFNARCPAPYAEATVAGAPFGEPDMVAEEWAARSSMKAISFQPETTQAINTVLVDGVGIAKNGAISISSTSPKPTLSMASLPSSMAPVSVPEDASIGQGAGMPARRSTGIELPHARKASLARFLEKRKDRAVQVPQVGDQQAATGEKRKVDGLEWATCGDKPRDGPVAVSSSKMPRLAPSPSGQSINNLSSRDDNFPTKRSRQDDNQDEDSSSKKLRSDEDCCRD